MTTATSVTDKQIKILTGLIADCQDRITYWREVQDSADTELKITENAHYKITSFDAWLAVRRNLRAMELLERELLEVKRQDIYGLGCKS